MIKKRFICVLSLCLAAAASVDAATTYGSRVSGLWKSFETANASQAEISTQGIAFDPSHQTGGVYDRVYLANHSKEANERGLYSVDLINETSSGRLALGSLDNPTGVAVASDGTVYVSYEGTPAVYKVEDASGSQTTTKVLGNYGGTGDDDIGNISMVPATFGGNYAADSDIVLFDCGRDDNANSAVSALDQSDSATTTLWDSGLTVNTIRGGTSSYDGYAYFVDYDMPDGELDGIAMKYINRVRGNGVVERVLLNIKPSKLPRLDSAVAINQADGSLWMAINAGDTRNVFRIDVANAVLQSGTDYLADITLEIGDLGYDVPNYSMAISPDGKLLAMGWDSGVDRMYVYNLVPEIDAEIGKIITSFRNAGDGNLLIAAHRGDYKHFPENSFDAMLSAANLGADIVEVDVRKTKDQVLVLLHDKTIDRTTNGSGAILELTFEESQKFFLKNPDGSISKSKIPALRDAMIALKGKCLIMLDKSNDYFDACLELSRELGLTHQMIFKSSKSRDEMKLILKENPDVYYGLGINAKNKDHVNQYRQSIEQLNLQMLEISYTQETTWLISEEARRLSDKYDVRIWNNSLDKPRCSAGRCDSKALKNPDENWGWQIEHGIGIIQTDEISALRDYLISVGRHD